MAPRFANQVSVQPPTSHTRVGATAWRIVFSRIIDEQDEKWALSRQEEASPSITVSARDLWPSGTLSLQGSKPSLAEVHPSQTETVHDH